MTEVKAIDQQADKEALINNWQQVKRQINQAYEQTSEQTHRAADKTTLLAVSKTKPADLIATLAQQGQRDFW